MKKQTHTIGGVRMLKADFRVLGKVWHFQPAYILLLLLHALLWAFINALAVYFRSALFTVLEQDKPFWNAAVYILALAVFYVVIFIPDFIYNLALMPIVERKMRFKMHRELYQKAQSLDIACYDDPDFYNQFVWAMRESDTRAVQVLQAMGEVVNHFLSSTAIVGLLFSINVWIGLIILVINLVGSFVVDSIGNRIWIKSDMERNPLWRRQEYIDRVFYLPDYAKEMRSGQTADMMEKDIQETTSALIKISRRVGKQALLLYGGLYNVSQQIGYYATLLIMIAELSAGRVLLGDFAAAMSALWILEDTIQSLSDGLAALPKHALYLDKYFAFLDHENVMLSGSRQEVPPFASLTFENVSFSYAPVSRSEELSLVEAIKAYDARQGVPQDLEAEETAAKERAGREAHREVLQHINLTLRRGEKIAIVGYNGAGKTTLIKLILRLYDPTEGRILYNGIDIREFDLESYHAHMGAVFQDYRLFASTVAENVMGGRYDGAPDTQAEVRAALDAASFTERLQTLEKGLDTPLTRELEESGVNLSGGEAQKVAIARVFVRPYELIIMDEPSSALDPVAEYQLNHSILNAADRQDRTVIFISHRLSTTRFADRILLFAHGQLCEQGTHEQLMAQDGTYARMFNMQAAKYRAGEGQVE